jgi:tetratricopeptide (TPR) repeat protein
MVADTRSPTFWRSFFHCVYQEALRVRQKVLGPQNRDTARSLNNLAALYKEMGEYAKAESLYSATRIRILRCVRTTLLRVDVKLLGPEHRSMAGILNNLAELYKDLGEYAKAEPLYQEALRIRQRVLGPVHPSTEMVVTSLTHNSILGVVCLLGLRKPFPILLKTLQAMGMSLLDLR